MLRMAIADHRCGERLCRSIRPTRLCWRRHLHRQVRSLRASGIGHCVGNEYDCGREKSGRPERVDAPSNKARCRSVGNTFHGPLHPLRARLYRRSRRDAALLRSLLNKLRPAINNKQSNMSCYETHLVVPATDWASDGLCNPASLAEENLHHGVIQRAAIRSTSLPAAMDFRTMLNSCGISLAPTLLRSRGRLSASQTLLLPQFRTPPPIIRASARTRSILCAHLPVRSGDRGALDIPTPCRK